MDSIDYDKIEAALNLIIEWYGSTRYDRYEPVTLDDCVRRLEKERPDPHEGGGGG